uniref:Recombinase Flp protein n=1 Tax=Zygosaccharomyces bisporus TaxID=4957 RepID=FLP_ZYGBI|nr:RecName: Full=Recombinase Flp protein [Zygosaccharomyces bisporus]
MSSYMDLVDDEPATLYHKFVECLKAGENFCGDKLSGIITMAILKAIKALTEVKKTTFNKYKTTIKQGLQYDVGSSTISFVYHLKDCDELSRGLSDAFEPYKFKIKSNKEATSFKTLFRGPSFGSQKNWRKKEVDREVDNLFHSTETDESIFKFILNTLDSIETQTNTDRQKTVLTFILLMTFFNCCRNNDLMNVDPSTFKIVKNKFVGYLLQAEVKQTKTRKSRNIFFFPIRENRFDLFLALHDFFRTCQPTPKSRLSDQVSEQKWQLFRDSMVIDYNRFFRKFPASPIFAIKHGPKSHLGRHLMNSFLHKNELDSWANSLGNWSSSQNQRESGARLGYTHGGRDLPQPLFGFLAGYCVRNEEGHIVGLGLEKDINDLFDGIMDPLNEKEDTEICESYGEWAKIVSKDVLIFLKRYHSKNACRRYQNSTLYARTFLKTESVTLSGSKGSEEPSSPVRIPILSMGKASPSEGRKLRASEHANDDNEIEKIDSDSSQSEEIPIEMSDSEDETTASNISGIYLDMSKANSNVVYSPPSQTGRAAGAGRKRGVGGRRTVESKRRRVLAPINR